MTYKQVLFQSAAREKVVRGATQLANAVRITLGPKSKSVLIQKKWGAPLVCNDGVTIAKEFELKDPEENLGARMLRQAAEKTGDAVGDGTSTATLLAHAIFADGARNVVAGASAIDLKRGLDRGCQRTSELLVLVRGAHADAQPAVRAGLPDQDTTLEQALPHRMPVAEAPEQHEVGVRVRHVVLRLAQPADERVALGAQQSRLVLHDGCPGCVTCGRCRSAPAPGRGRAPPRPAPAPARGACRAGR